MKPFAARAHLARSNGENGKTPPFAGAKRRGRNREEAEDGVDGNESFPDCQPFFWDSAGQRSRAWQRGREGRGKAGRHALRYSEGRGQAEETHVAARYHAL